MCIFIFDAFMIFLIVGGQRQGTREEPICLDNKYVIRPCTLDLRHPVSVSYKFYMAHF